MALRQGWPARDSALHPKSDAAPRRFAPKSSCVRGEDASSRPSCSPNASIRSSADRVARKLRGQLFVFENGFGDAGALRILIEPAPGPQARTVQVDNGDLAIGRLETLADRVPRLRSWSPQKRDLRLSSPALNSVETIVFAISVPGPFGRNCARHSTELPAPLGLTDSIPV